MTDDTFLLCFNAHYEPLQFTMPDAMFGTAWRRVIDTADPDHAHPLGDIHACGAMTLESRSMTVLQLVR